MLMAFNDVGDDRIKLGLAGAEHDIGFVDANHRAVCGDRHHAEVVDGGELVGLGHGGTGHPRQPLVEAEEVLQGDGRERLILRLDLDTLLGLN